MDSRRSYTWSKLFSLCPSLKFSGASLYHQFQTWWRNNFNRNLSDSCHQLLFIEGMIAKYNQA